MRLPKVGRQTSRGKMVVPLRQSELVAELRKVRMTLPSVLPQVGYLTSRKEMCVLLGQPGLSLM